MKVCYGRTVESTMDRGLVSLRDHGAHDYGIKGELSKAGFKPGEDIVIITVEAFKALTENSNEDS